MRRTGALHGSRSRAFSLVEVVLTVAIVGALALIAVPRFSGSSERYRAELAARRVIFDLQAAQEAAKATSSDQRVRFSVGGSSYYLSFTRSATASGVAPGTSATVADSEVDLSREPYRAQVVGADIDGYAGLVFDPYGMPSGGGTILLRVGSTAVIVSVDASTGESAYEVINWGALTPQVRAKILAAQAMPVNATYRSMREITAGAVGLDL